MAPVQRLGEVSWSVVCAARCHMALVFAVCFLNRHNTEGTKSSKNLCLMFVYVLLYM